MKSTIIVKPHSFLPDTNVVEVHHNGKLLCTVAGADGPCVRIISKHANADSVVVALVDAQPTMPGVVEIVFLKT